MYTPSGGSPCCQACYRSKPADGVAPRKRTLPCPRHFKPVRKVSKLPKRALRLGVFQGRLQRSRSIQTGKKRAKLAIFSRKICGK
ncbi:unknown [Prevotella sp. CAG:5226]|nr:unknown [Prevotella sp. CAG:5226]